MIPCDVLVLGVGGVGSAALMHLARRGVRAIGIDRFAPPHDRGSSHGQTRAIRQAYFEHPAYVPLLQRAYALWDELEAERGAKLFHRVGLVEAGPSDGAVVPGVLASASQHGLPVQRWTADECRRRLPAMRIPEHYEVVFEENAGLLLVESCVRAHCEAAIAAGAEIRRETAVHWKVAGDGVQVTTDTNRYSAGALVVAAGAWSGPLLAELQLPLTVVRKHLHWHPTDDARLTLASGFPVFFIEEPNGRFFYGFPQLDERGIKVAEHSGGAATDPDSDPRLAEPDDQAAVTAFLGQCFPTVQPTAAGHAVCFYTLTPDHHFLLDRLPGAPQVALAAGLSGHGFKFTTVLGETLAQLVTGESPTCDIDFLRLR